MRNRVMSSRPRRPLPPTKGWMASNCSCSMAHCTRSGTAPRSCRNASHCESASCISEMGVGTYVAVASVEPGGPDPVLRGAELAGRARLPHLAHEQALVQRAHEVQGERLLLEPLDAEAQRGDAAAHLAQVVARHGGARRADLVEQQVRERDVGAFDARSTAPPGA